jgi:Eco29kI restriction endonuclease
VRGFREFEFDLPDALLKRLVDIFNEMDAAGLAEESVREVPDEQGVYLLQYKGAPVYVGKTDGDAGLRQRLSRHCESIQHRRGLNPADVTFKAIRIYVFTVIDLETDLIREFRGAEWNNSGFGSNDPGRERDTTKLKEDGFDARFPIDIDRVLDVALPADEVSVGDVIDILKGHLPYILRVERHQEIKGARLRIPQDLRTTRAIIGKLVQCLPTGWQATALAGRVIMYRENREYAAGAVIARS